MIASSFALEVVAFQEHSSFSQESSSKESSEPHSGCDDACQVGQCHFGHCSHMNFTQTAIDTNQSIAETFYASELIVIQTSFDDGLTRPPRLS